MTKIEKEMNNKKLFVTSYISYIFTTVRLVQEPLSKALIFYQLTCLKSLRADMSVMLNASNISFQTFQTSS